MCARSGRKIALGNKNNLEMLTIATYQLYVFLDDPYASDLISLFPLKPIAIHNSQK